MRRLIESVPNFSEGRQLWRIDAIAAAMAEVPNVFLLDRHSDPDHNRSVITIAGEPEAVAESILRGVGKAAEVIDLTEHAGAHPRIGATDVVPFVPIRGITLAECAALAREVGQQIWTRYRIPVYLYEAAARRPERIHLENIRRGEFEELRKEVLLDPDRTPDIGGPALHPTAGATVVGARNFLIAYNINLNTSDLEIARQIARKVRFSSGGLPYLKAMAIDLSTRHLSQVSMNLTDFEQTPVHQVFEAVKQEAERHGISLAGSEIVGLIPRRAIEAAAEYYLQLENFSPAQVLENRIESAIGTYTASQIEFGMRLGNPSGEQQQLQILEDASASFAETKSLSALAQPLLAAIAAPHATPAGGAVAALVASFAAALGEMAAGISLRKKSLSVVADRLRRAAEAFHSFSVDLAKAADRDAEAYAAVLAARKLPQEKSSERAQRDAAIQQASVQAIEAPLEAARGAADIFERLGQLESICGPSILADVHVARMMAASALHGNLENIHANLESVTDSNFADRVRREANSLASRVVEHHVVAGS